MPRRSPYTILLSSDERAHLEAVAAQYTSPYCEVVRARIVLYAALGMENQEIADRLDLPRQVVSKWRKRFFERRLEGLQDDPRAGRPPGFPPSRGRAHQKTRL
jgi:transposase-like protein